MKNVNFTPGPWTATINLEHDGEWSYLIAHDGGRIAGNIKIDIASETSKANARLIAAAPEMLDALKTALEFVDSGGLGEGINAHAKATLEQFLSKAIAKAEGRGE